MAQQVADACWAFYLEGIMRSKAEQRAKYERWKQAMHQRSIKLSIRLIRAIYGSVRLPRIVSRQRFRF